MPLSLLPLASNEALFMFSWELIICYTRINTNLIVNFLAVADQDYTGLPNMFTFVTGQSLSCILISIIDDSIVENKETLSLILQPLDSSPGVRISRGRSTVEIIDNDQGKFIYSKKHNLRWRMHNIIHTSIFHLLYFKI